MYTKHYRVLTFLKRHGVQIAGLQETHLSDLESTKVAKKWRGQFYSSTFPTAARGVLVWMVPGVPFVLTYMEADVEGRYVLVQGRLDGQSITI